MSKTAAIKTTDVAQWENIFFAQQLCFLSANSGKSLNVATATFRNFSEFSTKKEKAAESKNNLPTAQFKVREAKRAFFMNLFDLSWRLAGAMLAPIFIGLYIDSKRGSGQGFALAGFLVGMICGVLVMRSVVKNLAKGGKDV